MDEKSLWQRLNDDLATLGEWAQQFREYASEQGPEIENYRDAIDAIFIGVVRQDVPDLDAPPRTPLENAADTLQYKIGSCDAAYVTPQEYQALHELGESIATLLSEVERYSQGMTVVDEEE